MTGWSGVDRSGAGSVPKRGSRDIGHDRRKRRAMPRCIAAAPAARACSCGARPESDRSRARRRMRRRASDRWGTSDERPFLTAGARVSTRLKAGVHDQGRAQMMRHRHRGSHAIRARSIRTLSRRDPPVSVVTPHADAADTTSAELRWCVGGWKRLICARQSVGHTQEGPSGPADATVHE